MSWLRQLICGHPVKSLMVKHIAQKLYCPICGKEWDIAAELCITHGVGLILKDREYAARGYKRIHQVK